MNYRKVCLYITFLIQLIAFNARGMVQDSTKATTESTIKATAAVDSKEVPLNRTITCSIIVEWSGDIKRYLISEVENPVIENFEIVSTSAADRRLSEGGMIKTAKIYEYVLQPKSLGMGYIENMIIKYIDNETGEAESLITPRLIIKVTDPLPEPGSKNWLIRWIGIVCLAAALFIVGFLFWQKKIRDRKRIEAEAVKIVPLEEEYLTQLRESLDLNSPDLNINEIFWALSRIARKYLSQKYQLSALESTTEKIITDLSGLEIDETVLHNIKEILSVTDLAKFAGSQGNRDELDRIYTLLEAVFERNLSESTAERQTGETK